MSTPISAGFPYCSPSQMVERYDVRTLGDLLSDTGVRLTPAQVLASPILANILQEASGWFEMAAFQAARYTLLDVQTLLTPLPPPAPANTYSNGAHVIIGMVAGITMWFLIDRRPELNIDVPIKAKMAMEMFDRLHKGDRILPLADQAQAGLPDPHTNTPDQIIRMQRATWQAGRLFGQRGDIRAGNG